MLDVLRLRPHVNAVSTPDLVDKYKACFEGVGKLTDYQVQSMGQPNSSSSQIPWWDSIVY